MANVFDKIVEQKHAVCESSLVKATECGHIYSLKCHQDLDNGAIVSVGAWAGAQVFESKEFEAGTRPILILTAPIGYNSDRRSYQDEQYFYNAEGEIARGYELTDGDIFTVSEIAFDGEPEVGKFIDAKYKVADAAGSTGFVGEIVEKVVYTNSVSYRVFVRSVGM